MNRMTSPYSWPITASCNGSGNPFELTLPSRARPNIDPTISAKRTPGMTSTSTCASVSPTCHQSWTTPAGTDAPSPGSKRALAIADEKAHLAAEHEEALVDRRMDVRRGHAPAGADEQMRDEHLLGMLPRVREHDDALAGDGILEHGPRRQRPSQDRSNHDR